MNEHDCESARALGRGDLTTSLLYIFPLLLIYQVGILFSSSINGADFVSRALMAAVGDDRVVYLGVHLALALAFFAIVYLLRSKRSLAIGDGLPMVAESAIYALTLGSLILVLMDRVFGMAIIADADLNGIELGGSAQAIVASIGAGVHEELVFRLGVFAGLAFVLSKLGVKITIALLVAAVASSLLFSMAHHLGPYGEPFATRVFVYRALAGAAFTAIFYFRSLAHAVYSHFLYDVYVLVIHQ